MSRRPSKSSSSSSSRQTSLNMGLIGVLILLVGISLYLWWPRITPPVDNPTPVVASVAPEPEPTPTEAGPGFASAPALGAMDDILAQARHIKGQADAPVTIIEFSDFKCPFCARFAANALPRLSQNYVETGQLRFAYMHIATLGEESTRAAVASECAAEQDQFWAYHDQIYLNQATDQDTLDDLFLTNLAAKLGLDQAAFENCLNSGRHEALVKAESDLGNEVGVQATPGFIINGQVMMGAQPYEAFAQLIDTQLTELGVSLEPSTEIDGLVIFPAEPIPGEVLTGQWQNCGIYNQPLELNNILAAMAHGAIWVGYRPDLASDELETLKEVVRQHQGEDPRIILAPEPSFGENIIATAWRVQMPVLEASDPRLAQFLAQYQDSAYTPQPGQPCTDGIGQPVE